LPDQGDSGGPLTYKQQNGQHVLVGTVSFGNRGEPESYACRIAYVRQWIDDYLKKQTGVKFCKNGGDADLPSVQLTTNPNP